MTCVKIRPTQSADISQITEIYNQQILYGSASFETEAITAKDMETRWSALIEDGYPHIVAIDGKTVLGYAYAGRYRPRAAYRYTVENSVYVCEHYRNQGIGQQLLGELIAVCKKRNYQQMVSIIGDSANQASIGLHAKCGFEKVGTLIKVGKKHGKWLDTVVMQLQLKAD